MKTEHTSKEVRATVRDLILDAEALAVDLRNAVKGYGVGNLRTKANLAEHIHSTLQEIAKALGE